MHRFLVNGAFYWWRFKEQGCINCFYCPQFINIAMVYFNNYTQGTL